jgi:hypothetical protein
VISEKVEIKEILIKSNFIDVAHAKEIFVKNKEKLDNLEIIAKKGISEKDLDTFFAVIEKMKQNIIEYKE